MTTASGFTNLDIPGATRTALDSIVPSGLMSGSYLDASGVRHGLIYDTNTGTDYTIDYPGSTSTYLYYSNNSNSFVGYYNDADGNPHSLLVTVASVPEPSSIVMTALGMAGLGAGALCRHLRRASDRRPSSPKRP